MAKQASPHVSAGKSVSLDIAGIALRLHAAPELAALIERVYGNFLAPPRGPTIQVIISPGRGRQRRQAPYVSVTPDSLTIQDGATFSSQLDGRGEAGRITLFWQSGDDTRKMGPLGLYTALSCLVAVRLVRQGGLLVHASAVCIGRAAVIGVGRSGAGKSTLASLFPVPQVLGDELIAVGGKDGRPVLHATPFSGTLEQRYPRRTAQLGLAVHLAKGRVARLVPIDAKIRLGRLMRCVALPHGDLDGERLAFAAAARLAQAVPWAMLRFPPDARSTCAVLSRAMGYDQ